MLHRHKIDLISMTKSLNALLLIGFSTAMFSNMVLAGLVWKSYTSKSRTLIPPRISQAFTVSDGVVDEAYLQQMAEYFAFLKLNVTPSSVEHQYQQLGAFICHNTWHLMQPLFASDAAMIKRQNISSHFTISRTQVVLDKHLIKLTGTLSKYVGKRPLEPELVSYIFATHYGQGQLCLLTIKKSPQEDK